MREGRPWPAGALLGLLAAGCAPGPAISPADAGPDDSITVALVSPLPGAAIDVGDAGALEVVATVASPGSPVVSAKVYLCGGGAGEVDGGEAPHWTLSLAGYDAGRCVVGVRAANAAGRQSEDDRYITLVP
ncbi:MAG: hypothetical protein ACYDCL_19205 [Myxococcales bacterium]